MITLLVGSIERIRLRSSIPFYLARERDVEQNEIRAGQEEVLQALIAGQRAQDPVPLPAEMGGQDVDHPGIVIDHEDSCGRKLHHCHPPDRGYLRRCRRFAVSYPSGVMQKTLLP